MENDTKLRSIFLTCWIKDCTQSDVLFYLKSMTAINKIAVGGIEKTENEQEHFHVIATFRYGVRFSQIKKELYTESIHIEPLRNINNAFDYVNKESNFYNDFELVPNTDIYAEIMNMIVNGMGIKELALKYPKFVILHYKAIKEICIEFNNIN